MNQATRASSPFATLTVMTSLLRPTSALRAGAIALALLAAAPATGAVAKTRKAPAGTAFYAPPKPLPAGKPGDVIWSRPASSQAALKNAAKNLTVLYRSTDTSGKPIAVSGLVSIPKGKAPKTGWPVISWSHGTTGIADACAPSRDSASSPVRGYIEYVHPVLSAWLKAGYTVVRSDFQGLGTPGLHPYLVGHSEANGAIDIVRAARKLDAKVGRSWVSAGHSQGGQAALFAAADGPSRAPELKLKGVAAYAPASHILDQVNAAKIFTTPSGLSGLGALFIGGIDATGKAKPADILKPAALALDPQVDKLCLPQLTATTSRGGIAPADILRDDADLTAAKAVLSAMNPALKIKAPVLLLQGDADSTVFKPFTDQLLTELKAKGDSVDYRIAAGVDHGGIVSAELAATTTWLKQRLR